MEEIWAQLPMMEAAQFLSLRLLVATTIVKLWGCVTP
jgi:hypothetical protein